MTTTKHVIIGILLLLACVCSANAQGRTATVITERANLRESPSQDGAVKQEIAIGTSIRVLDQKGAWYVVRIGDMVGWLHGNTFRFGSSAARTSNPTWDNTSLSPPANTSRPARSDTSQSGTSISRPSYGRMYYRGPRGGCYYYSSSGRKVYVDRSLCN